LKSIKKQIIIENKLALFLSVFLHGVTLVICLFMKYEFDAYKISSYSVITFTEISSRKSIEKSEVVQEEINETKTKHFIKKSEEETPLVKNEISNMTEDTSISKSDFLTSKSEKAEDSEKYLRFARTLLDTFLITHPEYSSLILIEQTKTLKDDKFSRRNLERKLNDEIHTYLSEKYQKGSDHAINKYTGPGVNIPIGDLVDIVKNIFE